MRTACFLYTLFWISRKRKNTFLSIPIQLLHLLNIEVIFCGVTIVEFCFTQVLPLHCNCYLFKWQIIFKTILSFQTYVPFIFILIICKWIWLLWHLWNVYNVVCHTSYFGLTMIIKEAQIHWFLIAVQKLLHIKLRPECFPKLQELLYARLCFAWKELFPMCYNKTNLYVYTIAQNGCCHTMKKPVTCEIFGSLTREYPDDFFPRCAFVQLVDGYQRSRWTCFLPSEVTCSLLP